MEATATDYAGFWRRALAALLDNVVWLIFYFWFISPFFASLYDASVGAALALLFVYASLWFNYFAFCEWRWGQTIGKNATGIEVRTVDGRHKLSYAEASIRNLLRLIDFWVIGEVMIVSTSRHQRLGDKAAKTIVVRRTPRTASGQEAA